MLRKDGKVVLCDRVLCQAACPTATVRSSSLIGGKKGKTGHFQIAIKVANRKPNNPLFLEQSTESSICFEIKILAIQFLKYVYI